MNNYLVALDLSTKTGFAIFKLNSEHPMDAMAADLLVYETIMAKGSKQAYPMDYIERAEDVAEQIWARIHALDIAKNIVTVVIEETNGSKSRYTQKILEFIHYAVLVKLIGRIVAVTYVNTSDWRKTVGIYLTKEEKKKNQELSKAKSAAKKKGEKLDKKKLGITGKITKKHLAVSMANEIFNLNLKQKDNDQAEAILIGYAHLLGAPTACPQTK